MSGLIWGFSAEKSRIEIVGKIFRPKFLVNDACGIFMQKSTICRISFSASCRAIEYKNENKEVFHYTV